MCGIAGIITKNSTEVSISRIKNMTDIIAHRGPDGDGQWISSNGNVGLGHRRLSIIDLSHEADQPMHYYDRYSIVFNGEIYNYVELKETLIKQGYQFKTKSDTEVLMALYDRDKENCLQILDGMFSFVIYDQLENNIFCARDRFGEKPFFYSYEKGKYFLFGSEMKCLWAAGIAKESNNKMLFNYLAYGFLDNPDDLSETFFTNCTRLPHAHFIKINVSTLDIEIKKYYNLDWKNTNNEITVQKATEKFNELFNTSVKRRLRSDVAVGSSLSGGLDSSLVVCVIDELKKGTNQKQNTFSAVFPGFEKDERKYMDYVIAKTNVEPHFVTPTDDEMIADLEKLAWHQEEPFGSASIYVQYKVMQLAKENNVTVLLDGQGADEILAGYHGYYIPYFQEIKKTPLFKEEIKAYNNLISSNKINPNIHQGLLNKIKIASFKNIPNLRVYYEDYKQLKNPFFNSDFYNEYRSQSFQLNNLKTGLNEILYKTTFERGLQELLRYADRNSMANSREVRLPFLSHDLVNFIFTLPSNFKIRNGWTKWVMRESATILPDEIRWRKDKIGYEPPQKNWMDNKIIRDKIHAKNNELIQSKIINNKNEKLLFLDSPSSIARNWRILTAK